ncbi:hypothetical protein G4B88_017908 [Cannabis sativa]|uniref:RING-type domain-containing protein n=1 Tax=Cannabis sativa TaxID=3483 RepID=A0A7J6HK30_CANSA|nr:hypothetical protein G4B88_017908 [Cannabis sativa]
MLGCYQQLAARPSYQDSLKILEADIHHANMLAASIPRGKGGKYLQMKLVYSELAPIFVFLLQWMDCSCSCLLSSYLNLFHVVVHKMRSDGSPNIASYGRKASISEFYAVILPSLQRLHSDSSEFEITQEKSLNSEIAIRKRYEEKRKRLDADSDREDECGICLEPCTKMVLPNCCHAMNTRSESCPFCRGSIKRVNSEDLWVLTSGNDVVDTETALKDDALSLPKDIPDALFVIEVKSIPIQILRWVLTGFGRRCPTERKYINVIWFITRTTTSFERLLNVELGWTLHDCLVGSPIIGVRYDSLGEFNSTFYILSFTPNIFFQVLIKPKKLSLNRLGGDIKSKIVLNKKFMVYSSRTSYSKVDPVSEVNSIPINILRWVLTSFGRRCPTEGKYINVIWFITRTTTSFERLVNAKLGWTLHDCLVSSPIIGVRYDSLGELSSQRCHQKLSLNRLGGDIKSKIVFNKKLVVYSSGTSYSKVDSISKMNSIPIHILRWVSTCSNRRCPTNRKHIKIIRSARPTTRFKCLLHTKLSWTLHDGFVGSPIISIYYYSLGKFNNNKIPLAFDGQLSNSVTRNSGSNSVSIIIDTNLTDPKQSIFKVSNSAIPILSFTPNIFFQILIEPTKLSLNRLRGNIKSKVVLNKESMIYSSGTSHSKVDPISGFVLVMALEVGENRIKMLFQNLFALATYQLRETSYFECTRKSKNKQNKKYVEFVEHNLFKTKPGFLSPNSFFPNCFFCYKLFHIWKFSYTLNRTEVTPASWTDSGEHHRRRRRK